MATGPTYRIEFARPAAKEFRSLPRDVQERIAPRIAGLAINPRTGDTKKLTGEGDAYRIRVGDYRVLYAITDDGDDRVVFITSGAHRRDAYRP